MKRFFLLIALFILGINTYSQEITDHTTDTIPAENYSISAGFLQAGGSLFGIDFESLFEERYGIQVGIGYLGFDVGLNFHFKPKLRSSFISLQYMQQGFGQNFAQSLVGPSFVYRGKRWFTFQVGVGYRIESGPKLPSKLEKTPFLLTYSIGVYFVL